MDAHDHGLAHDLRTLRSVEARLSRRRAHFLRALDARLSRRRAELPSEAPSFESQPTSSGARAPIRHRPGTRALEARLSRRRALGLLAATPLAAQLLPACDEASGPCDTLPEETAGPYPGDGSNGPNVLNLDGVVRSDITTSFGSLSGTAQGVPLTINSSIVNAGDAMCSPVEGAAVYLWHCDRDGNYSLYTNTSQNYLRGVQASDENGLITFTTIFPGCYSGRWPHIHFEVYKSLDDAMSVDNEIHTSQIALPEDACDEAYATSGYSSSVTNLGRISLSSDNIFSDGVDQQMAEVSGNATDGFEAFLEVPIDA